MAIKEKSITEYKKAVSEAKQKFLEQKINYGWVYTIKEEAFPTMEVFWICNIQNAKKIIFDHEQKFLWERDLYMSDIKILSEMKGELQ